MELGLFLHAKIHLVDWFRGWIGGLVVCMSLVEQIVRGWSWVGRGWIRGRRWSWLGRGWNTSVVIVHHYMFVASVVGHWRVLYSPPFSDH